MKFLLVFILTTSFAWSLRLKTDAGLGYTDNGNFEETQKNLTHFGG